MRKPKKTSTPKLARRLERELKLIQDRPRRGTQKAAASAKVRGEKPGPTAAEYGTSGKSAI